MVKVKRSNEKARVKQRDSKLVSKVDARPGNNVNLSLQMETNPVQKGDGIQVLPEGEDIEELDYEDDLSVDEEMGECVLLENVTDAGEIDTMPRPGTSSGGQDTVGNIKEHNIIQQLVNADEQNEEKLLNNPVIQKMMMKFFQENFKGVEGKGMNENNGSIKG